MVGRWFYGIAIRHRIFYTGGLSRETMFGRSKKKAEEEPPPLPPPPDYETRLLIIGVVVIVIIAAVLVWYNDIPSHDSSTPFIPGPNPAPLPRTLSDD
jgi:hypothetical protein